MIWRIAKRFGNTGNATSRPDINRRGLMLVLSSPSGAGKTTISRKLLSTEPHLVISTSVTTRPPRPAEADGKDYYFVAEDEYHRMVNEGEFLEHARVFDNFYGTPRKRVEEQLAQGRDMLFDIDWQGTQQLKANARDDVVSVFILPPSYEELERRLRSRGQDSEDVVRKRMSRAADEMSHWAEYDYIVINHDIDESVSAVRAILRAERLRRSRRIGLADFVNAMRRNE